MKTFASALLLARAATVTALSITSHPVDTRPSQQECNQIVGLVESDFPGWTDASWWSYIEAKLPAEANGTTKNQYCSSYHGCKALIECNEASDLMQCFNEKNASAPCQVHTEDFAQVEAEQTCNTTDADQGRCDPSSCTNSSDCDELAQVEAEQTCNTTDADQGRCDPSSCTNSSDCDELAQVDADTCTDSSECGNLAQVDADTCTDSSECVQLAQIASDDDGDAGDEGYGSDGGNDGSTSPVGNDGTDNDSDNGEPHPDACASIKAVLASGIDNWDDFYAQIPDEYKPVSEDEVVGAAKKCGEWNNAW